MSATRETLYFEKEIELSHHSTTPRTKFPARLAYWTFGDRQSPAVLLPSCYGGTLEDTSPFLYVPSGRSDPPFSPSKYFIIVVGLLGGGESSSPSNAPAPWHGVDFPHMTYEDNVRLQHALCVHLGVERLHAYIGFSMGGQQAYHMSVLFPDFVEHMVCIAGSARTSWHNWCFLEGPKAALISSADFDDGAYTSPAKKATRAFGRVYCPWALSPEWFRRRLWEVSGCKTLEEFLDKNWSNEDADANNLLAMLWTWQQGNVSDYFPEDNNDLALTLKRINAKCLIMPCRTDQYFRPKESEIEVQALRHGKLSVIESVWGHVAGGGDGPEDDNEFMKREISRFLQS